MTELNSTERKLKEPKIYLINDTSNEAKVLAGQFKLLKNYLNTTKFIIDPIVVDNMQTKNCD